MKLRIRFVLILLSIVCSVVAQKPEEVYRKPLKEVLDQLSKKYEVNLEYSESLVRNLTVTYPEWRYRSEIEATLTNILMPLDLVFQKTGDRNYRITAFEYYRRPPEEGKKHLDQLLALYPSVDLWEKRKAELRKCFLERLNLSPLPKKSPLNPIVTNQRKFNGYIVENVAIESIPGVYLTGSLYRPAKGKGPFPAVLCPYGHFSNPDTNLYGRYRPDMQYRCATLARMGAVVFSYDMFAWGESRLQFSEHEHRTGLAMTMQTLNSMRAIDFIVSLPYVDGKRIGITGASGGGTQSFLAAALDDRITVSVPVVMVSSYFFGGCPCESGLPVHSCSDYGTNNAEIAAMVSPKPMLVISDGSDWTQHVPEIELPYLKKIYKLYGKEENIVNVHLADEGHDYGFSKRIAMYEFMARHLGLKLDAVRDKNGNIDESAVTIEKYDKMLAFGKNRKLPENALRNPDDVRRVLKSLQ
ncbi:MAG: acetylxylan esterase [Bacteroidales bacterium]|nr:acetylxylan esterase [Bacteroidales bacterium]